eukprot:gb/GEZN01007751.1/.p1 GENE.gb/GEZN01007751.1/~~gb/GEZN01007751.1/.p1  ORF type:complete len:360 (+),score=113.17 gb/GEZN01007751.1/:47-1126(+)
MDPNIKQAWEVLTSKTHTEQAQWFLNGFWSSLVKKDDDSQAALIYQWVELFKMTEHGEKVIEKKGKAAAANTYKEGSQLEEHKSHQFIEKATGEAMTAIQVRESFSQIDIDKNHRLAMTEWLAYKFRKTPKEIVESPQGESKELNDAMAKMAEVQAAILDTQQKIQASHEAVSACSSAISEASKALHAQQESEEEVRKAEAEAKKPVDDLQKEQEKQDAKLKELQEQSENPELSTMQKAKAGNLLAQAKKEDPTVLREAKIHAETSLHKVQKIRRAAEKATAKCAQTKADNEAAKEAAHKAKEALEAAENELKLKLKKCEELLVVAKAKGGGKADGNIWWMERQLKAARDYSKTQVALF